MNSSGIVRKVDELGRIVIPIEIRKILNIREGESIEFNINGDNILLSKKSIIRNYINILYDINESIRGIIDGEYIISDREKVLISSDESLLDKVLDERIISLLSNNDEFYVIDDSMLLPSERLYVFPYSIENNISGFIIIYKINDVNKYTKLVKFINNYINNNLSISQ